MESRPLRYKTQEPGSIVSSHKKRIFNKHAPRHPELISGFRTIENQNKLDAETSSFRLAKVKVVN